MHILYPDESGEPRNMQEQTHFVIAGVAVHESCINYMSIKLREIQKSFFPDITYPIELHANEIRGGRGFFKDLPPEKREQILSQVYKTIISTRYPSLLICGAVMGLDAAKDANQVRKETFEEVCSSFNSFLVWEHRITHTQPKGLIIIDRNREDEYKQLLDSFRQNGTKYGYLGNIVDIPYFAQCRETPMLQAADFCSYAMYRYYEKQDDSYLNQIMQRIYKTIDGKMFGLKHITKKKPCSCVSCCTMELRHPNVSNKSFR